MSKDNAIAACFARQKNFQTLNTKVFVFSAYFIVSYELVTLHVLCTIEFYFNKL